MIRTKQEFLALSQQGRLGNYLQRWDSPQAVEEAGYLGYVSISALNNQSPYFEPWCHARKQNEGQAGFPFFGTVLDRIAARGGPGPEGFYFLEVPPPNAQRRLNLEAGWIGHHDFVAYLEPQSMQPVRGIRERVEAVCGVRARLLLRTYLLPQSYETLQALWDLYPDSIIEATEYSQACGVLHQNLVVWEVRCY